MLNQAQLKERIASILRQPVSKLCDQTLLSDLVTESFVLVELAIELQEEFGVRLMHEDLSTVKTVGDLTRLFLDSA